LSAVLNRTLGNNLNTDKASNYKKVYPYETQSLKFPYSETLIWKTKWTSSSIKIITEVSTQIPHALFHAHRFLNLRSEWMMRRLKPRLSSLTILIIKLNP